MNAAAAIYIAGHADSLESAVDVARQALEKGLGATALDKLREASIRAAREET
jgi:anthranilate phosphoribosyltransferase